MLLPLQAPEIWDEINQKFQTFLGYPLDNPIKTYPNLYTAVDEVTNQIASFLSHKNSFTWIKGNSPLMDSTLPGFLREGMQVQSVDWKVFEQLAVDPKAWVESLPKDTLFVLGFEDHAVTAQKLHLQSVEEHLNQKKIYFIRVSHFSLPVQGADLKPYTIWIGPAGYQSLALVISGSRFRAPERGIAYQPWKPISFSQLEQLDEDQNAIENFESNFTNEKWFQGKESRRYDRAALCFSDVTGEILRYQVLKSMGEDLNSNLIETPHTCYLQSLKALRSWWTPQPEPDKLRGLILISLKMLKKSKFVETFQQSLNEIRKESLWPNN